MDNKEIHLMNGASWNAIADDWFGATALPVFGPTLPKEDELKLFGDIAGKKILDIGCGSGHSLLYNAKRGAAELWGLDLSSRQIENAQRLLTENNLHAELFISPMEENPGIPQNYFDVVYSIYAFGWTLDLKKSIELVHKYLKAGSTFIFSWDNPLMQCISAENGKYILSRSYLEETDIELIKATHSMIVRNWKLSSYINELASVGFKIEKLVEETDKDIFRQEQEFTMKYYSNHKAQFINTSFILKASKL